VGGYRDSEKFGAADAEVRFGRYVRATAASNFVALVGTNVRCCEYRAEGRADRH